MYTADCCPTPGSSFTPGTVAVWPWSSVIVTVNGPAANAVAGTPVLPGKPNQFVYVKSYLRASTPPTASGSAGWFEPATREAWLSVDG
jgi:hypothetical protein